ncbi:hypothetical protein D3C71_1196370 [compost metagenome]
MHAQRGVEPVIGNIASETQGVLDRSTHRADDQHQAGDQHASHQQQGGHEQHAGHPSARLLTKLRLSQCRTLRLLECGQCRAHGCRRLEQRLCFHVQADTRGGIAQQRGLVGLHAVAHALLHLGGQARQCQIEGQLLFAGTIGMGGIAIEQQQCFLAPHPLHMQGKRRALKRVHLCLQCVGGLLQLRGQACVAAPHLIHPLEQRGDAL